MTSPADFPGFWVHFIETVYGAWLYGDARGFRTRHHREHVDGDYKRPPPPQRYAQQRRRSERSLKQPPVVITPEWRPTIGTTIRERLEDLGAFVLCLSLSGQHMHVLAKIPAASDPRDIMGRAKKHSTFEAKARGWQGKLWAKRGKELRVRDRAHQLNAYRYILDHAELGAWVWVWRKPTDGKPTDGSPWA